MTDYVKNPEEPYEYLYLTNKGEPKNFLQSALTWKGSATPKVLPRVGAAAFYSVVTLIISKFFPAIHLPITPFEYSGAVVGLILVARVNAGVDRWWEARKAWGSIVNQSRNLAIIGSEYFKGNRLLILQLMRWTAAWPHAMRESLRKETALKEVEALVGKEDADLIRQANHMPTYVGARIAGILSLMRGDGFDDFAFQRAERERALLIDAIGVCERIRNTPIPLVLAIKTRRFILLFLLLLPLALFDRVDWLTPLVVALASYPLFSLDEIGAELQNPFSKRNLSHLPLTEICKNIEGNVMSLAELGSSRTS